jgi:hypothetical protein
MTLRLRALAPRLDDLYGAPQLAALAILEAAADVTVAAVLAAHPLDHHELDDDHSPLPERRAASALVDAARTVAAAINRYRLALVLARERERDDILPF